MLTRSACDLMLLSVVAIVLARVRGSRTRGRARQLGVVGAPIGQAHPSRLDHEVARLGLAVEPVAVAGGWLAGAVLIGAWSSAIGAGLVGLVVVETVYVACSLGARATLLGRLDRRRDAAVAPVLEAVARELRIGATLPEAVRHVASRPGPLADDLQGVCRRADLGLGWASAIRGWGQEASRKPVRSTSGFGSSASASAALALAHAVGGPAAGPLDALATRLRRRQAVAAEVMALSTQGRWSAWVVVLIPVGTLVLMAVADPATAAALTTTGIGRGCLIGGLALDALGAGWMRTIIRGAR